jgi:predicted DsbA family dithiol-disulfide isomerase
MKIEIWSDVMCPFCYLGKRKFENALAQFADKEYIEVEWKSFELNPDLVTDTSLNINQYLSDIKGFPLEQAQQMSNNLTQAGKQLGLEYNFNTIVVANSFKAHNLIHFAKTQNKQNEIEERLFEAYFTEGKNIDDSEMLIQLAAEIGLNANGLDLILSKRGFAEKVQEDITEARQLGIRGVPYFIFNRKYAISGAQETPIFLDTIRKSFTEWHKEHPEIKRKPATYSFNQKPE